MNPDLRDELIRDEELRLTAYKDSLGYWTIGVGHLLGTEARMTKITNEEAMSLFVGDIEAAEERVEKFLTTPLDEVRSRALINMSFNLGNKIFQFKKFIAAVNNQEWSQAGTEMLQSVWAKQVGQRAIRLHAMITTGKVLA